MVVLSPFLCLLSLLSPFFSSQNVKNEMLMGYVKSDSKVILNLDRSINGSSVYPVAVA